MSDQEMKITAQPSLDPNVCTFKLDRTILWGNTIDCRKREDAAGSPLLEALFAIEGVREVLVSEDTLTVAKSTDDPWQVIGKKIGAELRAQVGSGKQLFKENYKKEPPSDEEIKRVILDLFEHEINPAIAMHGGAVDLIDVKNGVVSLRMSGGCQGCGAATQTLRYGIERAIREKIPEVVDIVDITDHTAGVNPYY